jgi:hypothetical protein
MKRKPKLTAWEQELIVLLKTNFSPALLEWFAKHGDLSELAHEALREIYAWPASERKRVLCGKA